MRGAGALRSAVVSAWAVVGGNSLFVQNSAFLLGGSLCAAGLGCAYWWLVSRSLAPEAAGAASAIVSTMSLLGEFNELGLGTLLLGGMAAYGARGRRLVAAAVSAVPLWSMASVCLFLVLARPLLERSALPAGGRGMEFALILGSAATSLVLVLDQALLGELKAKSQFLRAALFAVTKLIILIALLGHFAAANATLTVLVSWNAALIVSILFQLGSLGRVGTWRCGIEDIRFLLSQTVSMIDHHVLNVAAQAPMLILPLLLATVVSPSANAAFYPAWMLFAAALLIPAATTSTLYSIGAQDPWGIAGRMRLSLLVCTAVSVVIAMGCFLAMPLILSIFNESYPSMAGRGLDLLGLGMIGASIKYHYLALMRLTGGLRMAALWFSVGGLLELVLAGVGGRWSGLDGLAVGWVIAVSIEGALMLRPVLRAQFAPRGGLSMPLELGRPTLEGH